MLRARRAAHLFFRLTEDLLPDVERLLQGEMALAPQTRLLAASVLTGRERVISLEELELLSKLSTHRWTTPAELGVDVGALEKLAADGLVVLDEEHGELGELRRRDDRLTASGWNAYAALYHSQSRWRDVDVAGVEGGTPPGTPPAAFHSRSGTLASEELPVPNRDDGLFRLLLARRTTRSFDRDAPLTREEVSLLLYYTFGCHGVARVGDGVALLRKFSPSGGSLHPIEVYPLAVDVAGLEAGLYHYRADRHAVDLVERLDADAARERAIQFLAGQTYLESAGVFLIVTARFTRSFWKYRSSSRALAVVLMDAGHLSQTLYLLCTALGLGTFVSAAVNSAGIEDALGLDPLEEGVVAVCGCGRPRRDPSPVDVGYEPYVPRESG